MTIELDPVQWAALRAGVSWLRRTASVVHLRGPDARRFSNGMFTNNVRDLPQGFANRHAVVDDRGRVGGFLDLLCRADDHFVAVLDGVSAPEFCERYETYVVFDDVELEDATGEFELLTLVGPRSEAEARSAGLSLAEGDAIPIARPFAEVAGGVAYWGWGWPEAAPRWLVDSETADALMGALDAPCAPESALRILAGMPAFPVDTGAKGLPHELGLRESMLNFDKGCYLGQESINRIDVMGQVRRKLRIVDVPPGPDVVGAEVALGGKSVGSVTSAIRLVDGHTLGLAVLREPAHEPGSKVEVSGRVAQVLDGVPVDRLAVTE